MGLVCVIISIMKNINRGIAPILVLIYIVVAVVVGGGAYYAVTKDTPKIEEKDGPNENSSTNTSLKALLNRGGNYICTFSSVVSNSESTGTVYISGTNMRGDFSSKTSVGVIASHMIRKGDSMYVWSDASATQGVMMTMTDFYKPQANAQTQGSVNADANLDYKCENWSVDQSKFTLPSAVNFVDIQAMMKGQLPSGIQIPKY